jgi:hypothetical protein
MTNPNPVVDVRRLQQQALAVGYDTSKHPVLLACRFADPDVVAALRESVPLLEAELTLCQGLTEATPENRTRLHDAGRAVQNTYVDARNHGGTGGHGLDGWEMNAISRLASIHARLFGDAGELRSMCNHTDLSR